MVTGASGIAAAAASRFTSEGGKVYVVSIDPDQCARLASAVDLTGWTAADLSDEAESIEAIRVAREALGRIDGVFAVAGGSGRRFGDGPAHQLTAAAWESTLALNLTTTFLTAREGLRHMLEVGGGGSIVIVSSVLATHPVAELFATHAYAAAKGAQISLALAMASGYVTQGIRVNVIAPGLVRTPMSERAAADPATVEFARVKQPLAGGFVEPDDIAAAATFLLSDQSRSITGQVLSVDAGWGVTGATV